MHQFQQFTDQLNGRVRANSGAQRRGYNERNVGLHVLGRRVYIDASCLYGASEFVRGRRWRWCYHVRHSDPNATAASELKIKQGSNFYPVEN